MKLLLKINWITKLLAKLLFIISYQCLLIVDALSSSINQDFIYMNKINMYAAAKKRLPNAKNSQQYNGVHIENIIQQRLVCETLGEKISNSFHVNKNLQINIESQQNNGINHTLHTTTTDSSYIASIYNAKIFNRETFIIAKIMQWQVNFHRLQEYNHLSLMMNQGIFNIKCKCSQLLGVFLGSDSKNCYTIRVKNAKYYDLNKIYIMRGFLRFPTAKQFRISSNFNLRRLNPITGRMEQHRGVDFAMPQGTPVLAVGDGKVVVAKHSDGAGFYITVRHGGAYTTRYMHLYKLLVKEGQKVKCGDRIALSGNSGRSTGPHLHYEVWINKQPVNPLTAKLPRTEWLISKDRNYYIDRLKGVILYHNSYISINF